MNITELSNIQLRNQIRGALSNTATPAKLTSLASARRLLNHRDTPIFTAILCTTDLEDTYYGPPFPSDTSSLYLVNRRQPIDLELELNIQINRLHHHLDRLLPAAVEIGHINDALLKRDASAALDLLEHFRNAYGVSSFLAKKVAFLHFALLPTHPPPNGTSVHSRSSSILNSLLGHHESRLYSQYINLILDNFDIDTSCFQIRHDHLQIWKRSLDQVTRKTLLNLIMQRTLYPTQAATILHPEGLLFFSSSSLLDLLADFLTLSYHSKLLPPLLREFLSTDTFNELRNSVRPRKHSIAAFLGATQRELSEQAAYRASFAFAELRQFMQWRQALDNELCQRDDMLDVPIEHSFSYFSNSLTLDALCTEDAKPMRSLQQFEPTHSQIFLRTIAVLNQLRKGAELSQLSALQIRLLLSQTSNFSKLLTEHELLRLRSQSERDESHIICFLSMVMLNAQKPNEDLEFEMRMTFQQVVQDEYGSNILDFLIWLFERTPNLCPPMVELFDISFLERLYLLHDSFEVVLSTREEICRWAARHLDSPELDGVANRLALDRKVREIRGAIDDTRIFVDDLRYQQWGQDNLAPVLRKYERTVAVSAAPILDGTVSAGTTAADRAAKAVGAYYWFAYACEMAFREFCHNKTFGIDSYLSRRVRHGTLAGTLVAPIQDKVNQFRRDRGAVTLGEDAKVVEDMMERYRSAVDTLRDELLHFRSEEKERGLLHTGATSTRARTLLEQDFQVKMLGYLDKGHANAELCPLFLEHCWNLLAGDLFRVRDELRNYFVRSVRPLLRGVTTQLQHPEHWRPLLSDIDRTAEGLFSTVASWFSRSQGPSMTVTVKELVEVVAQEVKQYRPGYEGRYEMDGTGEESLMGLAYQTSYDILYICFTNAAAYADPTAVIRVQAGFVTMNGDQQSRFRLSVTSSHGPRTSDDTVREAIQHALANDDKGESMIREGNTGLAKARALMKAYGPGGAFSWWVKDGILTVEVILPIILV